MVKARTWTTLIATLVAVGIVATAAFVASNAGGATSFAHGRARAERIEQALSTDRRLSAAAEARRAGRLGQIAPIVAAAAPGWAGEQLASPHRRRLGAGDRRRPRGAVGLHDDDPLHRSRTRAATAVPRRTSCSGAPTTVA